ncbi:MAG: hypothetical protein V9F03_06645 [Microthrixaceae bacterium]
MGSDTARVSSSVTIRIGLVLTLAFAVIGSVRFARFDWTGLPLDRAPITSERQVGDCLEKIKPYVTESGRVIKPVVVDEMQYLALVEHFRGVPDSELQVTCLYDPFTFRSAISWVAHWLPFDEALSLGLTNSFLTIVSIWLVVLTLREQKFTPRVIFAAGALYTVSWNLFYFGSVLLIDPGVVVALTLSWLLILKKRPWFVLPILALGYPLRDTFVIMIPVIWAWCWAQYRDEQRSRFECVSIAASSALVFFVSIPIWRAVLPQPAAAWEVTPDLTDVISNLGDPIGLMSFAVGVLPLALPSWFVFKRTRASKGWMAALTDPATVGVIMALGICGWTLITVDLTPRLFWIGYPFAVTLAARWLSDGRPAERLAALRIPFLGGADLEPVRS